MSLLLPASSSINSPRPSSSGSYILYSSTVCRGSVDRLSCWLRQAIVHVFDRLSLWLRQAIFPHISLQMRLKYWFFVQHVSSKRTGKSFVEPNCRLRQRNDSCVLCRFWWWGSSGKCQYADSSGNHVDHRTTQPWSTNLLVKRKPQVLDQRLCLN